MNSKLKLLLRKSSLVLYLTHIFYVKKSIFLMKKFSKLPINPRKVVLFRPKGGYGDNPRAVAEYLHENRPEYELVWISSSRKEMISIPEYVRPTLLGSKDCFRELSTACAWVCTAHLPTGTIKRDEQLYIQTWHGDKGFKKFGRDTLDLEKCANYCKPQDSSQFDYFFTGSRWFIPIIKSAFGYEGTIIPHGLPRNDCLINWNQSQADIIRNRLGISLDSKILIYAPTFRDSDVVDSDIDLSSILFTLEQKTRKNWICLLKAHPARELKRELRKENEKFINVTSYPDIADLLMISDMLITDYSSCAGDFALTDRFILLYQDDIASYTKNDRALYFDMKETPYYVAHDLNEALEIIDRVDDEAIKVNCAAIRDFYDVCETGKACEEIVELIDNNRIRLEEVW